MSQSAAALQPPLNMADMPVQLPSAPADAAQARARYFNSGNAFNVTLPPVPAHIFRDEAQRALAQQQADAAVSGYVLCDRSAELGCAFPATTPLMLARYAHIAAGGSLSAKLVVTGSIWYVIAGSGTAQCAGMEQTENFSWTQGDVFLLPGGADINLLGGAAGATLWMVANDPQLAHDGLQPGAGFTAPVHYPATEIALQLERVFAATQDEKTSGLALIFSSEKMEASHNILPTLTLSFNTLPPGEVQRAHSHNSAAITLIVQGEGCHSMVAGAQCDWSPWATMITPPTALHSHHNEGKSRALFLIVQDGGLYYHARTMGFRFAPEVPV
jgi:gentisate 1,2-dioxygenase